MSIRFEELRIRNELALKRMSGKLKPIYVKEVEFKDTKTAGKVSYKTEAKNEGLNEIDAEATFVISVYNKSSKFLQSVGNFMEVDSKFIFDGQGDCLTCTKAKEKNAFEVTIPGDSGIYRVRVEKMRSEER